MVTSIIIPMDTVRIISSLMVQNSKQKSGMKYHADMNSAEGLSIVLNPVGTPMIVSVCHSALKHKILRNARPERFSERSLVNVSAARNSIAVKRIICGTPINVIAG